MTGAASGATGGHLRHSLFERHADHFLPDGARPTPPEPDTTGPRAGCRPADGVFVEALALVTKEACARRRLRGGGSGTPPRPPRPAAVTAEGPGGFPEVLADRISEDPAG